MKTRERILQTSLLLFNECGEPNVTTLQIADELDISPGNLYYHFKNKSEILNELFGRFEQEISELLESTPQEPSVEDEWFFLHLIFEAIARYRFLYQDLVNILSRNERIHTRFKRILTRQRASLMEALTAFKTEGMLKASDRELSALSENMSALITLWMSYGNIGAQETRGESDLNKGIYQVMSLLAPFLAPAERNTLEALSADYLDD